MKYLSFDIEATGLDKDDLIIEFGAIPFCTESKTIQKDLGLHRYIKCPSFQSMKDKLNPWVAENNKELIEKAYLEGVSLSNFKNEFNKYINSENLKNYFSLEKDKKIVLFGKSLNAIDLPFLSRDLGYEYMRENFHYQTHDLSSIVMALVDAKIIPPECTSGSKLMKFLNLGEVCHTALEDAYNTAKMYLMLLDKVSSN